MIRYITILTLIFTGCSTPMKQTTSDKLKFDQITTPGYAIRKIKNNMVVADLAGGKRSINFPNEISLNEKWHLGSCTKSMTAYLIAILIDEKKLTLDTKINSILDLPIKNEIGRLTIKNLLTHRSGLTEVNEIKNISIWTESFNANSTQDSRNKLVREVLNNSTKFSQDQMFDYSNSNYMVLGAIIEKIENKPWETVLKNKIFDKLGMTNCGFGPAASRNLTPPDQPWGHKYENQKLISIQPLEKETEYSDNPAALGPAGTVHCSFDSWSLFLKEMLAAAQGKSKLLSAQTAKLFFTPYKDHVAYGGWGAAEKPWADGLAYTMIGSNTLGYAMFIIAPNKDLILMGATNSGADESLKELSSNMKDLLID